MAASLRRNESKCPQLIDTRLKNEEEIFGSLVPDSLTIFRDDGFFTETLVTDKLQVPRGIDKDQNLKHKNSEKEVGKSAREVDS